MVQAQIAFIEEHFSCIGNVQNIRKDDQVIVAIPFDCRHVARKYPILHDVITAVIGVYSHCRFDIFSVRMKTNEQNGVCSEFGWNFNTSVFKIERLCHWKCFDPIVCCDNQPKTKSPSILMKISENNGESMN